MSAYNITYTVGNTRRCSVNYGDCPAVAEQRIKRQVASTAKCSEDDVVIELTQEVPVKGKKKKHKK